jgi:predicted phosphoribosyltransferase
MVDESPSGTEGDRSGRFHDRRDAGRQLAGLLESYAGRGDVIVLALPRGGIPVGYEVAKALRAPLDVFVVRKLGVPGYEELALGALASGGARVINEDVVRMYRISQDLLDDVTRMEQAELDRREQQYRGDRPFPELAGKTIILVDDGLATGATMRAAIAALREKAPARVVVAVPVSAAETCTAFRGIADDIVCAVTPEPFYAVGLWYEDFSQTTDDEVHELLARANGNETMV